jgi:BirA family biotin operon repressor/biotin-[acetyl-CoA-carboxylase] ligase
VIAFGGWPDGVRVAVHDVLDSTNEEARRLALAGEFGPLWILAREQTAGRGRRGRTWVSNRGNLFATLLTHAAQPIAAHLAFAAGLAVAETVDAYSPRADVSLKWPNDVLVRKQKVAGILLESLNAETLAIGVGINLAHHPQGLEFPATSIAALTGSAPDPDDTMLRLARHMAAWYEVWQTNGFVPVRAGWLQRAVGLHQPIKARLEGREMEGVFEGLDQDGALLLRDPAGVLVRVTAGEVFF